MGAKYGKIREAIEWIQPGAFFIACTKFMTKEVVSTQQTCQPYAIDLKHGYKRGNLLIPFNQLEL